MAKNKNNKTVTIISIFLLLLPFTISLMYFITNYLLNKNSFLYNNTEELSLISHYSFWWYLVRYDILSFLAYLLPLVITMLCCSRFFKVYHSKMLNSLSQENSYKEVMQKEIKLAWLKNLILPMILAIFFVISYLIFPNGIINKTNIGRFLYPFQIGHEYMNKIYPSLFVVLYLLIVFLYGVFITNLGIILSKFIKKLPILIIGNYIVVIILDNIFNFALAPIVKSLTKIDRMANGFSILNIYYLDGVPSLWWEFVWIIFLICITIVIIYKLYKNNDKIINN